MTSHTVIKEVGSHITLCIFARGHAISPDILVYHLLL